MPTASKSGTRSATRQNWRGSDQPRSRRGPRSRPYPNPFTDLATALNYLIRFHQTHTDWFPPPAAGDDLRPSAPPLRPEWAEAIQKAYHPDASCSDGLRPPDVSFSASDGEKVAAGRMMCPGSS